MGWSVTAACHINHATKILTSCTLSRALMWSNVSSVGDRPPCRQNTCGRTQYMLIYSRLLAKTLPPATSLNTPV